MVESQSSQKIYQGLCMFLHTSFSQKWYSSMLINQPLVASVFAPFFDPQRTRHFGLSLKTHTRRVELKLKWEDVKTCLILSALKTEKRRTFEKKPKTSPFNSRFKISKIHFLWGSIIFLQSQISSSTLTTPDSELATWLGSKWPGED